MRVPGGHRFESFGTNRKMVAASATVGREKNTIHLVTEVDVTVPRRMIAEHRERTGEQMSLTGYVVTCLARTFADFPDLNAFRKGRRLVVLEDVAISVVFERDIEGESVPEPVGIQGVNRKTYREVNDELRAEQQRTGEPIGSAMGQTWVRFIPGFLLRSFTRLASRDIGIQKRYGVAGVTAVGMFGSGPMWLVPLTGATVTVAVGSIAKRPAFIDGAVEEREHLCLTVSFDHDIVDGAPAARFTTRFAEILSSGDEVRALTGEAGSGAAS